MKGLIVTTKHEIREVDYDAPNYDVISRAVGGYYEHVCPRRLNRPYCMMVNEEGLLNALPLNVLGSYLYETDRHGAPIVGDIIILKEGHYHGEPDIVGLTEEEAKRLRNEFSVLLRSPKLQYLCQAWGQNLSLAEAEEEAPEI